MLTSREANARLQSDFFRDQFRKVLRWLFYSLALMVVLIGVIVYFILVEPNQAYYANTQEGNIFPMPGGQH